MASGSLAVDVQFALQRAKTKISNLQRQLSSKEPGPESPAETGLWTPSKELRDSLVDMYTANPRVNVELRQRLPSPAQQPHSPARSRISLRLDHNEWPQAPPGSCSPPPLSLRSSVSPAGADMEVDSSPRGPSPSRGPSPTGPSPPAESCRDARDGGDAPAGPRSPAHRRHLVTDDDSFQPDASIGQVQFEREKNISFLLKELDALRETNQKLQDQLVHKEKELQRREVEEELREARGWETPAARLEEVLEEVLAAQKDRDQALMSRLLLANEERDEALLRARRLQQAAELETFDAEDTNTEVQELLQRVCDADSVQEVERYGSVLVRHLQLARHRRNDITAQEMKAVMEERDGYVAKCKRLEQDLDQEREQRATEAELLTLQRERDRALEDGRRLEAELRALRANHRPQDLLAPPPLSPGDGVSLEVPPPQAPPPLAQLLQMTEEKQSVEAELRRCQEAEQEASERVRRLERLVEVLRKKVGTGSLRAVI